MYITGGMRTRRNRYGRSPHEKGWITATREPSQELMRLLTADARCLLRVSEANADGREVEAGRAMGRASGGSSIPPVPVSTPQARGGPTLGIAFWWILYQHSFAFLSDSHFLIWGFPTIFSLIRFEFGSASLSTCFLLSSSIRKLTLDFRISVSILAASGNLFCQIVHQRKEPMCTWLTFRGQGVFIYRCHDLFFMNIIRSSFLWGRIIFSYAMDRAWILKWRQPLIYSLFYI